MFTLARWAVKTSFALNIASTTPSEDILVVSRELYPPLRDVPNALPPGISVFAARHPQPEKAPRWHQTRTWCSLTKMPEQLSDKWARECWKIGLHIGTLMLLVAYVPPTLSELRLAMFHRRQWLLWAATEPVLYQPRQGEKIIEYNEPLLTFAMDLRIAWRPSNSKAPSR
jgi:hypothetical protein